MSCELRVPCLRVANNLYPYLGTGHKVQWGGPAEIVGGSSIFRLMKRGGSPKYWSCL